MKSAIRMCVALLFALWGLNADAGFIGNAMEAHVYVPSSPFFGSGGTYSSKTFTVDDSVELPLFGTLNESIVDVSDTNISISFWREGQTNFFNERYVFSDIYSTIDEITNVSLNSSTNGFITSWGASTIFDISRISFDENNIYIDLSGISANHDTRLSLDIDFASVSEPSVLWLFSAGLISMVGLSRRFTKS